MLMVQQGIIISYDYSKLSGVVKVLLHEEILKSG
jgi:hypothetical protein